MAAHQIAMTTNQLDLPRHLCDLKWIQIGAKVMTRDPGQFLDAQDALGWNRAAHAPFVDCLVPNSNQICELLNAACRLNR